MAEDGAGDRIRWGRAVAWGCFLSASWLWVIGMYFPIYLLIDFGVMGWLAFALVNVPGAMLVGWVWRRAGDSERFVRHNEGAMRLFSIVTILFQLGFLAWFCMSRSLVLWDDYAYGAAAFGLLMVVAMLLGALGTRGWLRLAIVVMLASFGTAIGAMLTSANVGVGNPAIVIPRHDEIALALASPALAMGFLLCPHLDLTIQRARQEAPGATGTAAFVIGFGVLFLAMITFSLFYASGVLTGSWSYYVIAHIIFQATFTTGAHLRELLERGVVFARREEVGLDEAAQRRRRATTMALSTLAIVVAVVLAIALVERWLNDWFGLGALEFGIREADGSTAMRRANEASRLVYLSVLSLYALVFPAWLWIGVFMGRGLGRGVRLGLWILALAIAAPLFALGYLGERYALIPVAIGSVLVVGEVARRLGAGRNDN